jgi:hypothetical protein
MILVRSVFQAKFGKANELVTAFHEFAKKYAEVTGEEPRGRLLTDLSGGFDTVVMETEHENLAEWERGRAEMFANPLFADVSSSINELIESGRNEFYTIEA